MCRPPQRPRGKLRRSKVTGQAASAVAPRWPPAQRLPEGWGAAFPPAAAETAPQSGRAPLGRSPPPACRPPAPRLSCSTASPARSASRPPAPRLSRSPRLSRLSLAPNKAPPLPHRSSRFPRRPRCATWSWAWPSRPRGPGTWWRATGSTPQPCARRSSSAAWTAGSAGEPALPYCWSAHLSITPSSLSDTAHPLDTLPVR